MEQALFRHGQDQTSSQAEVFGGEESGSSAHAGTPTGPMPLVEPQVAHYQRQQHALQELFEEDGGQGTVGGEPERWVVTSTSTDGSASIINTGINDNLYI